MSRCRSTFGVGDVKFRCCLPAGHLRTDPHEMHKAHLMPECNAKGVINSMRHGAKRKRPRVRLGRVSWFHHTVSE